MKYIEIKLQNKYTIMNHRLIRNSILICLILIFGFLPKHSLRAERISLEDDIADGYLDEYSKIEAGFILSGITDPDSLTRYVEWYNNLLEKVETFPFEFNDPVGSARTVFMYLHSSYSTTSCAKIWAGPVKPLKRQRMCTLYLKILVMNLWWKIPALWDLTL